eukprot:SAG11_NODE_29367_length_311_cov_1.226415_1_plen_67_part_10
MAAVTDLASLCAAADLAPDDLRVCSADDLAEIFDEFAVKGALKVRIKKALAGGGGGGGGGVVMPVAA